MFLGAAATPALTDALVRRKQIRERPG